MNIYKYQKNNSVKEQIQYLDLENTDQSILPSRRYYRQKLTLRSILSNTYDGLKNLVRSSSLAGIIIPSIFVITGFFFIYQQFFPDIKHLIEQSANYLDQGNATIVTDNYINLSSYVSNPAGLSDLTKNAFKQNILIEDSASANFTGTFHMSIPALGMNNLPVQANVDSTNESVYKQVLTHSLAHFKGTGLPISNVENNIVIYDHSASPNYHAQPSDPYVAFTFLPNIHVGDDIYIDISGQSYHFKAYKSKIVDPSDTTIITGERGKRTLTLFTCYPLGSDAQRFVAIAREI